MKYKKLVATVITILSIIGLTGCNNNLGENIITDSGEKYNPVIEISFVKAIDDSFEKTMTESGYTLENNPWNEIIESELGIRVVYDWVSRNEDEYREKIVLAISTGNIPDVLRANKTQVKQLYEADLISELGDVFEKFATDQTKEILFGEGSAPFDAVTFNSEFYGLPGIKGGIDSANNIMWIRRDWLNNLGLEEPSSMGDVIDIIKAFTFDDPDKNGLNDTYGLALRKDLWGANAGGIDGFFNGFGAYPTIWYEKNGSLSYGSIMPETKMALSTLSGLFELGCIDKNFAVTSLDKSADVFRYGKVGVTFGAIWIPVFPLQDGFNNDNSTDWQAYPIYDLDGNIAKTQVKMGTDEWYVVSKECNEKEAVIKMMNLFLEKTLGKSNEYSIYGVQTVESGTLEVWKFSPVFAGDANKAINRWKMVQEIFETKSTENADPAAISHYQNVVDYQNGDMTKWWFDRYIGTEGSIGIANIYYENNLLEYDRFTGVPTDNMMLNINLLKELETETFLQIIMGEKDIEYFDDFVIEWKESGGQIITEEVNDWYKKK